jgi:hypothetical protein
MKDLQKIKEFFSKPVNEAIETPMDAIAFLNANKSEIIKLADQYKGDVSSMQKAIDNFLAPHIDGTPDFIIDKIKAAIGGAISKRNIAANPDLSATYDKLKNVRGVVKEKKETAVDMAKKQLDALGVKYELGNEFKPFKVIYKPTDQSDKFYDTFEDIVDLFNLKGVVKSSMGEAKSMSGMLSGKDFINAKLQKYPKAVAKINQLIDMIGESKFTIEMAEWIFDFFNNAHFESPMNEAKKEDKVDTITMDIPLFIRMLEYSREDAAEDMDLHDVTEKAISLGKERGILQMDDYDEIIGSAEEIKEASSFAQQAAIAISKKKSGNYDKEGKRMKETSDPQSGKAAPYGSGYKPLEERIAKALDQINEELCPAGKAYIKRRQAAGEKSSAYLSGRAVKVCKGQMSGRAKKKK